MYSNSQIIKFTFKLTALFSIVFISSCSWYTEWWYYDCQCTVNVTFINRLNEEVLIRDKNFAKGVIPFFIESDDTMHFSRSFDYQYHNMWGVGEDEINEMSLCFQAFTAGESNTFNQLYMEKKIVPVFDSLLITNSDPEFIGIFNDTVYIGGQ